MEARILGSGGWMPTDAGETTCVYFREGDHLLIVDAGTGLRRLATQPELVDGARRVSVVLTHFHLDHVIGLAAAAGVERLVLIHLNPFADEDSCSTRLGACSRRLSSLATA